MYSSKYDREDNYGAKGIVRKIALGFAVLFGIIALYFCLLPALAENTENGGSVYLYFDNGLSQYTGQSTNTNQVIQYSLRDADGNYQNSAHYMVKLSSLSTDSPQWTNLTDEQKNNINPDNIYVTTSPVAVGTYAQFRAWSCGTVYDTVVNYRTNSSSREWGYDYIDFQWTSPTLLVDGTNNCYFAPPQLMQNKYGGLAATTDGGEKSYVRYIYMQGENVLGEDGEINYGLAKPENGEGSIISPNNAVNRTFYDAEYTMEGKVGKVGAKNDLSITSQSSSSIEYEGAIDTTGNGDDGTSGHDTYKATAQFFDYFSDWELAGKPLENHTVAYGHTNANAAGEIKNLLTSEISNDAKELHTNNFPLTISDHGFTYVSNGETVELSSEAVDTKGNSRHANYPEDDGGDDGTTALWVDGWISCDVTEYKSDSKLYSLSACFLPFWTNTVEATANVNLVYTTASGETYTLTLLEESGLAINAWAKVKSDIFVIPTDCVSAELQFNCKGNKTPYHFDDFTLYEQPRYVTEKTDYDLSELFTIGFDTSNYSNDDALFSVVSDGDTDTQKQQDKNNDAAGDSSSGSMKIKRGSDTNMPAIDFTLLPKNANISADISAGNKYSAKFYVKINSTTKVDVEADLIYTVNGATSTKVIATATDINNSQWYEFKTDVFTIPENCTSAVIRIRETDNNKEFYLDDFTLYSATGEATDSLEYTTAELGSSSSTAAEIISSTSNQLQIKMSGAEYSSKELYRVSLDVLPYEDCTATITVSHYDSGGNLVGDPVELEKLDITGNIKTSITAEMFSRKLGAAYSVVTITTTAREFVYDDLVVLQHYTNLSGSFSEGTNRISYAYQGYLWNDAISSYYEEKFPNGTDVYPLYFGSNSWFTGNNRYIDSGYGFDSTYQSLQLATDAATRDKLDYTDETLLTYLVPYSRQYLKELYGFDQDISDNTVTTVTQLNEPMGMSNSRGVPGLISMGNTSDADLSNNYIYLGSNDTGENMPYFNEAFIEGDNSANAVYGSVYNNVTFRFKYEDDESSANYGYYVYDSTSNEYATRITQNTDTGEYYMRYTGLGVTKGDADASDRRGSSQTENQFYPFNSVETNDRFATENLMFGMKLDIPFNMFNDKEKRDHSLFKFSGDDDVWVYVDDTPVLDIGGTHTAVGGIVDLKNGYAVTGSSYASDTGSADTNYNVTASGTDTGVTDFEEAALAILASARIKGAENHNGINPDEAGDNHWNSVDNEIVEFFDDKFVRADASKPIQYQYIIDDINGVIKVKFNNIKKAETDKTEIANGTEVQSDKLVDFETGAEVTEGYAVLRLSAFQLQGENDDTIGEADLTEHTLSVYYLERGLNSSNFKLAFNFVENTERTVEKEWADGADAHTGSDSIKVELYRTEPEPGYSSSDFTFPANYMALRASAYSAANSITSDSAFANKNDPVQMLFKVADSSVSQSAVELMLNGMPLNKEMFTLLNTSALGLRVTVNGIDVTANDFIEGTGSLESDNGSIYLDLSRFMTAGTDTVIRVYFEARNQVKFDEPDELNEKIWDINTTNGWLVEAKAYDMVNVSQIDVSAGDIESHSTKTIESPEIKDTTANKIIQPMMQLSADDMRFVVYYFQRTYDYDPEPDNKDVNGDGKYDGYDYSGNVLVVPSENQVKVNFSSLGSGTTRYVYYAQDGVPILSSTYTETAPEQSVEGTADVKLLACYMAKDEDDRISNRCYGGSLTLTDNFTVINYSDAHLVGTAVLNEEGCDQCDDKCSPWKHTWSNIVESSSEWEEGSKTEHLYKYYLRETEVNSAYGDEDKYNTVYYDLNGNELTPEYIDYTDPVTKVTTTLKLYSIDEPDASGEGGYIKVVNIPKTDLTLTKVWGGTDDDEKFTVKLDVYTGTENIDGAGNYVYNNGAYNQVLAISAEDNWTKTIGDLARYQKDSNGNWTEVIYFIKEQSVPEEFVTSYSPNDKVTLYMKDGTTQQVFLLGSNPADLSVQNSTVTNRKVGSGLFDINLLKSGYENALLKGAEFQLLKFENNSWVEVAKSTTDTNGRITFSSVDSGFVDGTAGSVRYQIKELTAPAGYVLIPGAIEFTINCDTSRDVIVPAVGEYTYIKSSTENTPEFTVTPDDDSDTISFRIVNEIQPIVLPNTGGSGVKDILITGTALLLLALTGVQLLKKRSERPEK